MNRKEFALFLDELTLQVDFALFSVNMFSQILNNSSKLRYINEGEFWYYIQNYVIELANISKILFITKKNGEREKAFNLRKEKRDFFISTLGIQNIDAIKDKRMRNTLEHIDEKLEKFSKSDKQFIFNKIITPSRGIVIGDKPYLDVDNNQLRNYLTDLNVFVLFGKIFEVNKTYDELIGLKDKIELGRKKLNGGEFDDLFDNGERGRL